MIYNGVAIDFLVRICYNTLGGDDYTPNNYLLEHSEELATKVEMICKNLKTSPNTVFHTNQYSQLVNIVYYPNICDIYEGFFEWV